MRVIYSTIVLLVLSLVGCTSTAVLMLSIDEADLIERKLLVMDGRIELTVDQVERALKPIVPMKGLRSLLNNYLIQRRNRPEILDQLIAAAKKSNPDLSEVDSLRIQVVLHYATEHVRLLQNGIYDQRIAYAQYLNSQTMGSVLRSFGYPRIPLSIPGRGYAGWAETHLSKL